MKILDYKKRAEWNKTIYAWFAKISERAAGMVGSSLSAKKSVKELRRDATQRYIDMQCNVIDS